MPAQSDMRSMTDRQIKKCLQRFMKMRDNSQALLDECGRTYSNKTKAELRSIRRFADKGIQVAFAVLEKRAAK